MTAAFCQRCGGVLWGTTGLSSAHPCVCQPATVWYSAPAPIPQGWQCPQCKRIYSPDVAECGHCRPKEHSNVCPRKVQA